jgi:hypothetical protein
MTEYISFSSQVFGDFRASLDLMEESCRGVLKKVREQIKSPTMWHSKNDMLHAACIELNIKSSTKLRTRRKPTARSDGEE